MKAFYLVGSIALLWSVSANDVQAYGRGGAARGSVSTPRGGSVQYAGAGASRTGPAGVTSGRAAGGVQYTSPSGQTATKVGRAGGVQGPGGATVAGRSSVGVGPNGGVAASRGGVAVGPYGGAAASRGGVAVGPYGGVAASRGGIAVGPGGAAAARHSTFYASPHAMISSGTAVRGGYAYGAAYFNRGWYTAHPAAWTAARWTTAGVWAASTWASASTYCGITDAAVSYDYGSNVVYQDDDVYMDGEKAESADDFAASAAAISDAGRAAKPPADEEWQPLGVFGMVQGEETVANNLFQLAVNKAGIIRGNYYDALGDNNLPVYGSVNKTTQRVAWSVGEKKDIVYEAGLSNLTQAQCPVLIHYGKEKTRQMMLVRLEDAPATGTQPK